MNKIISILVLLILLYFSYCKIELFNPSSSSSSNLTTEPTSSSNLTTEPTSSAANEYVFELEDYQKNIINQHEQEKESLEIKKEKENMELKVNEIVNDAKNVLSYTNLNLQYLKDMVL